MTQDGVDNDIINGFKAKHLDKLDEIKDDTLNLDELGLKPKKDIKILILDRVHKRNIDSKE